MAITLILAVIAASFLVVAILFARWAAPTAKLLAKGGVTFASLCLFSLFIAGLYIVPTPSMEPTIRAGTYIVASKIDVGINTPLLPWATTWVEPERDGIYVFFPPHATDHFIKRVGGLPGDVLTLEGEAYSITRGTAPACGARLPKGQPCQIPEGRYFMVGDNPAQSSDSRTWGLVPKGNFVARYLFQVPILGSAGTGPLVKKASRAGTNP